MRLLARLYADGAAPSKVRDDSLYRSILYIDTQIVVA